MQIGIPKEQACGETRSAATPDSVVKLRQIGFTVEIASQAGLHAGFDDHAYKQAGASIVTQDDIWKNEIIFKVNAPTDAEAEKMNPGTLLVCFIWPAQHPELVGKLAHKGIDVLAMDMVPRISRAQSLDALSSIANIAGYRAVVEAAYQFGRFFTGQITAAGKVPPAKVMVIGAGVAGLSAIGVAHSLGAIVRAFDTRPEVKEQVESMGASFLTLDFKESNDSKDGYAKVMSPEFIQAEMALFAQQAKEVDIMVTTALIPGKPAPRLITKEMVDSMQTGSVIVDLAAGNGGNCELTVADEVVTTANGVKIIGYTNLPSRLPAQASQLYATNLVHLMKLLCKGRDGQVHLDTKDIIIRHMTVVQSGEITFPPPKIAVTASPQNDTQKVPEKSSQAQSQTQNPGMSYKKSLGLAAGIGSFAWLVHVVPPQFLSHFTVFVLACIIGYYVVWNVTHALHTPLMSVTNAISGIIVVGALLQIGKGSMLISVLAFIGILMVTINIVAGFAVTQRMLKMFRKN